MKRALDEKTLVNAFADRHAFELERIAIESGALVADEAVLQRHVKDLRSLEGIPPYEAHFILLQHSLGLLDRDPQSAELQDMCRNLMTLHLSSTFFQEKGVISAIYAELKPDVPTLLFASLPRHAAAVSVTLRQDATYDVVLINSGDGLDKHHMEYLDSKKGFHKTNVMGVLPAAFVPTIEFKGVTKEQLSKAGYHFGIIDQVYYEDQPEVEAIKKQHVMPWELTDSQGIGSCSFSSVWYALRFYYQALVFESDLRLSLLEQAISETVEVQAAIQKLVHKLDADYAERRQIAGKNVPYYSETVKAIWNEKDELEDKLRMRRELVAVGLNGILQNLMTLMHELKDIHARTVFRGPDEPQGGHKWVARAKMEKASARAKLLDGAIPRITWNFHHFWEEHEKRWCASGLGGPEGESEERIAKCMTWSLIADDTRTLYKDAIKLSKLEGLEPKEEQLVTDMVKKESKPLDVQSLPIHESLRLILDRMILEGDSEVLREAIGVHLQEHSANPRANEANYLLVLYAALKESAPLLDYLVSVKGMPLKYSFKAFVEKDYVMSLSDLKSERDILKFAASEFKRHGQPLDSFAQLFILESESAKRVAKRFVREYRRRIPTDNYDAALAEFAKTMN